MSIYNNSYEHLEYLTNPFLPSNISDNQFYFYPMLYIKEYYENKEQEKAKDNYNNKVEEVIQSQTGPTDKQAKAAEEAKDTP